MAESIIRLENISVALGGEQILKNLNLNINDKEFVTLLGPSGCGKTTTLRIIGGFQRQDSGNVFFANEIINDLPPYKRNVNTVFQKYALFPHLNVFGNIAYGLHMQKVPKEERKKRKQEIKKRVEDMLALVNLRGFENRDIMSLSGGQQQRVAIARALINKPHVLLLDEPLGALDLKLRKEMQIELKNIQIKTGITFIYVTHDQEEALTMSDIVVVMKGGEIQQIGTPQDIYNEPKNAFVADFIGESNILPGVMLEDYRVEICGRLFECVDKGFEDNEKVGVVVRPEDIEIKPEKEGFLHGVVKSCVFKGVHYEMTVEQVNYPYTWLVHSTDAADIGDRVGICFYPNDIHVMKGEDIDYSVFSNVPEEDEEE
jgi:spermidine/putrescine transport system ATP-binding protein